MVDSLTNEQIAQQLADMKAANDKQADQHAQQLADMKAANDKQADQHAQQLADMKAANDKLATDNQTIQDQNQKLMKALATPKTTIEVRATKKDLPMLPTQRVNYGQNEYAFKVPTFYLNGFYYTAEEIVADQGSETAQKIFGELLKIDGQGVLTEVK